MNAVKKKSKPIATSTSNYNGIRIASILFLLITICFTVLNIYISRSLEYDSLSINIAGRQRMLSQRIAKNISLLGQESEVGTSSSIVVNELGSATRLFDSTLNGFIDGGASKNPKDGSVALLKKVEVTDLVSDLKVAREIWSTLKGDIETVVSKTSSDVSVDEIERLKITVTAENTRLLKLMNNLTVGLEREAAQKSKLLVIILVAALALVFINFFYIATYSLGKLKKGDANLNKFAGDLQDKNEELESSNETLVNLQQTLTKAKKDAEKKSNELAETASNLNRLKEESDKIFESVDHGLCLITPDFKIGSRVSQATYDIFEKKDLSDFSFIELIRPLISEKDLKTLQNYLKLQFDGKTLASQLQKYNPLKNIELTMNWDGNNFSNKYVGFEFERIVNDGAVELVLITITDISERIALQRTLEQAEEEQKRHTELITELIQVDPGAFSKIIAQAERSMDEINELLRNEQVGENDDAALKNRSKIIDEIFRKIHNIKGNASVVGLKKLAEIAHSVEDKLGGLKNDKSVSGDSLLGSLVQLSSMRELISDYYDTKDEFLSSFNNSAITIEREASEEEIISSQLDEFAQSVAESLGKKVFLRADLNLSKLTSVQTEKIRDVFSQLIRNSLIHGIETTDIRRNSGKLEEGLIYISSAIIDDGGEKKMKFTFRDDGQGLQIDKIRKSALSSGLLQEGDPNTKNSSYIAKLIFSPGFSTEESASEHAGRGTGMDLVRKTIISDLNGKMGMSYGAGNFTEFNWELAV